MNCAECGHKVDVRKALAKELGYAPDSREDAVLIEQALIEIKRLRALKAVKPWTSPIWRVPYGEGEIYGGTQTVPLNLPGNGTASPLPEFTTKILCSAHSGNE